MIGIIDADLASRKKHRFPNLALMKISGYCKNNGYDTALIVDPENADLESFEKIYISKVFTDTYISPEILQLQNVEYGGTGFFYDKAEKLPEHIEHHMPDYDLYSSWVSSELLLGKKKLEYKYYTDYSIGFTTRGCFRRCEFCVNKNYTKVSLHSNLSEFIKEDRKNICLLDDNILGYSKCASIFAELHATNKRFKYKQGMDLRLMTEEKAETLIQSKYIGDYTFAFDNINDLDIIEKKLRLWRYHSKHRTQATKLYVFCGFDRDDKWNASFWDYDIVTVFQRIKLLMKYGCLPYIMRFNRYEESPYRGMYINLARWCNQPSFLKKKSFREYCIINGEKSATMRYLVEYEKSHPEVAREFFDIKFDGLNKY